MTIVTIVALIDLQGMRRTQQPVASVQPDRGFLVSGKSPFLSMKNFHPTAPYYLLSGMSREFKKPVTAI